MDDAKIRNYYEKVKEKVDYTRFKEKMKEFNNHFGGLIDDETLALLTAYSFGYEPSFKIEELANKKGKVVVEGTVEKTFGVRELEKATVTSIILSDGSGRLKVTLWNDAAKLVKTGDVVEGAKIKIRGFLRKRDDVELSVNDPADVEILDLEFVEISRITEGVVNVKGRVSGFGGMRKTSKNVEIAEIYISDESGRIRVLLWNDKVQVYKKLDIGDYIEIRNGYAKVGKDGEMEVHCGQRSALKFERMLM